MQQSVNKAILSNLGIIELSISDDDTVLVDHVHHTCEQENDDQVEGEEWDHVPQGVFDQANEQLGGLEEPHPVDEVPPHQYNYHNCEVCCFCCVKRVSELFNQQVDVEEERDDINHIETSEVGGYLE